MVLDVGLDVGAESLETGEFWGCTNAYHLRFEVIGSVEVLKGLHLTLQMGDVDIINQVQNLIHIEQLDVLPGRFQFILRVPLVVQLTQEVCLMPGLHRIQ